MTTWNRPREPAHGSGAAPLLCGLATFALLAALDRAFPPPAEPGAARAWLSLVLEHPWRSSLALVLAWQALLGWQVRPRWQARAPESANFYAPPSPTSPLGLGRSGPPS